MHLTPIAGTPAKPRRTASPREEVANIPLPPRHPPRDSIFTTDGSQKSEKPEIGRSDHAEAAKQRAIPKARKVKTKTCFETSGGSMG